MALNSGDILVYDGTKWVNQQNLPGALTWSGHATASGGSTPTVTVGGALGTGGSVTVTLDSNDTRGRIDFHTGTGPVTGQMVSVLFRSHYAGGPYVFLQALDFVGGTVVYSVGDHTPAGFSIYMHTGPAASTTYPVWYWVLG